MATDSSNLIKEIAFGDSLAANTPLLSANRTAVVFTYNTFSEDGADQGSREIVVGFGVRSVTIDQQFNVSQEPSVGHMGVQTVTHGVQSASVSMEKMMLRGSQLAKIGVAGFGISVMSAPFLNMRVFDATWDGRGKGDTTIVMVKGLHLQGNRLSLAAGATVGEGVTFRVDDIVPYIGAEQDNIHGYLRRLFMKRFGVVYRAFQQEAPYKL